MKEITEEEIKLLKEILSYIDYSPCGITTGYTSPAQSLRIQADLIEKKESDILKFKKLIERLK